MTMATQVAAGVFSRNITQLIKAANRGTPACINKILATVV
jgi:hypothetical protein